MERFIAKNKLELLGPISSKKRAMKYISYLFRRTYEFQENIVNGLDEKGKFVCINDNQIIHIDKDWMSHVFLEYLEETENSEIEELQLYAFWFKDLEENKAFLYSFFIVVLGINHEIVNKTMHFSKERLLSHFNLIGEFEGRYTSIHGVSFYIKNLQSAIGSITDEVVTQSMRNTKIAFGKTKCRDFWDELEMPEIRAYYL